MKHMKQLITNKYTNLILTFLLTAFSVAGQSNDIAIEKRVKAMHAAFQSSDKAVWEDYVKNNYSAKMLEKFDMARHLEMFERLHSDFGDSKIISTKVNGYQCIMVVERSSDKHKVSFDVSIEGEKPYKIDGFGINAGQIRR